MRKQVPRYVSSLGTEKPLAVSHLDGNRFHVFRQGAPTAIIECFTHILVRSDLAHLMSELCPNQVGVFPAELKVAAGEGGSGYCVIHPASELTPENIGSVATDGYRLWRYHRQYLFVAPVLAEVLRQGFPSELEFSHGFSMFAGYA